MKLKSRVFTVLSYLCISWAGFSCCSTAGDQQLNCKTTTDCPDGYVCAQSTGKCEYLQEGPVVIGTPVLAPVLVRKGETALLAFDVNKDLLDVPAVNVKLSGKSEPMTLNSGKSAGRHYVFAYTATGAEPQGLDCPVTIVLVDKNGLKSPELSGGVLRFDFLTTKAGRELSLPIPTNIR